MSTMSLKVLRNKCRSVRHKKGRYLSIWQMPPGVRELPRSEQERGARCIFRRTRTHMLRSRATHEGAPPRKGVASVSSETKTLSENLSMNLEQGRISPRMGVPR
jgi:hypothetical protein